MLELVYGGRDEETLIRDRFPHCVIKDARDSVHENRFSVELPDDEKLSFYEFSIREKFFDLCLGFRLMILTAKEDLSEEQRQILEMCSKVAKEMNAASECGLGHKEK